MAILTIAESQARRRRRGQTSASQPRRHQAIVERHLDRRSHQGLVNYASLCDRRGSVTVRCPPWPRLRAIAPSDKFLGPTRFVFDVMLAPPL